MTISHVLKNDVTFPFWPGHYMKHLDIERITQEKSQHNPLSPNVCLSLVIAGACSPTCEGSVTRSVTTSSLVYLMKRWCSSSSCIFHMRNLRSWSKNWKNLGKAWWRTLPELHQQVNTWWRTLPPHHQQVNTWWRTLPELHQKVNTWDHYHSTTSRWTHEERDHYHSTTSRWTHEGDHYNSTTCAVVFGCTLCATKYWPFLWNW